MQLRSHFGENTSMCYQGDTHVLGDVMSYSYTLQEWPESFDL